MYFQNQENNRDLRIESVNVNDTGHITKLDK